MIIEVHNTYCEIHIGGKDNLLPFDIHKELDKYLKVKKLDNGFAAKKMLERDIHIDGYKHFLSRNKFPTGFLIGVVKFLVKLGVDVRIDDLRNNLPVFKEELNTVYGDKTLYDYQVDAVSAVNTTIDLSTGDKIFYPRGIEDVAPNGGKTLIMLGIIDSIVDVKAIVLIHSELIFKQLVEQFSEFYEVGQVRSGVKPDFSKPITVCMIKTLLNLMTKDSKIRRLVSKQYNALLVDECHHAAGNEYQKVLKVIDAGLRVGLSGTAMSSKDKVVNMTILGTFSSLKLAEISNQDLIALGQSKKPIIHFELTSNPRAPLCLTYDDYLHHHYKYSKYMMLQIRDIVLKYPDDQILIIFWETEAGEFIYRHLSDIEGVILAHGKMADRQDRIDLFKDYKARVLIASTILREGVNIKNIDRVINCLGGESINNVKQMAIGRASRIIKGKTSEFTVHEFYPDVKYLKDHAKTRINIYTKEQFEITYNYTNRHGVPRKTTQRDF